MAQRQEIKFIQTTKDEVVNGQPWHVNREQFQIVLFTYDDDTSKAIMEIVATAYCRDGRTEVVSRNRLATGGNDVEYFGWMVTMSSGFMEEHSDAHTSHRLCRYSITEYGESCDRFDNSNCAKVKRVMMRRLKDYFQRVTKISGSRPTTMTGRSKHTLHAQTSMGQWNWMTM